MNLCQSNRNDGVRCASPAITGSTFCYFHGRSLEQGRNPNRETPANLEADILLPDLADPSAILAALSTLMQAVATNRIDPKRANLLLRGLSLAARLATALQKQQPAPQPTPAEALPIPAIQAASSPLRTHSPVPRPHDRLPRSLRQNLEARRHAIR